MQNVLLKNRSNNGRFFPYIAMFYTMVLVSTGVYVNKLITVGTLFTSAAIITFAPTFIIGDIVAEVYGYSVARKMIWMGLFCQFIFAVVSTLVVYWPAPAGWSGNVHFQYVLGNLIHVYFAALISAFVGDFVNIYFISKWKILLRGRYFWLRSLGANAIGKLAYTIVCVVFIYYNTFTTKAMLTMMGTIYAISIGCVILLATPSNFIVIILKNLEQIDPYDYATDFNPFKLKED